VAVIQRKTRSRFRSDWNFWSHLYKCPNQVNRYTSLHYRVSEVDCFLYPSWSSLLQSQFGLFGRRALKVACAESKKFAFNRLVNLLYCDTNDGAYVVVQEVGVLTLNDISLKNAFGFGDVNVGRSISSGEFLNEDEGVKYMAGISDSFATSVSENVDEEGSFEWRWAWSWRRCKL